MSENNTNALAGLNLVESGSAYINGEWVKPGRTYSVYNPVDQSLVAEVADLNLEEARYAIDCAHQSWQTFKTVSAYERANMLKRWYELIIEHKEALATLITLESGKPLQESRGEVDYGASFVEWYAEEAKRSYGDIIPTASTGNRIMTMRQGVGVVSAITSWNFPLAMVTRKVAPAIAAGCTILLRPASKTPLTSLALAKLTEQAGWPKGVIHVLTSARASEIGLELSTNDRIRKLSFTGSTEVGKHLMQQAAGSVKKVSLELGGNASFIVFDDANLESAVQSAMFAKFRNAGQTCVAVNRFYVQEGIYEAFLEKICANVKSLRVGNGLTEGVQIGPLVDAKGLQKVQEHVQDALAKGAELHLGGRAIEGLFFEPTVLGNVSEEASLASDETFGPVVSIFKFKSEEEVIERANRSEYGLASYVYSNAIDRCWRVAEALEVGIVGVNEGKISFAAAPFGGIKSSGFGREGSKYGLDDYTEIKYVNFGLKL